MNFRNVFLCRMTVTVEGVRRFHAVVSAGKVNERKRDPSEANPSAIAVVDLFLCPSCGMLPEKTNARRELVPL